MKQCVCLLLSVLILVVGFPVASLDAAPSRDSAKVILDLENGFGHLWVTRRSWPRGDRHILTLTFSSPGGQAIIQEFDTSGGESVTHLPGGVVKARPSARGLWALSVTDATGEERSFLVGKRDKLVARGNEASLRHAMTALLESSEGTLTAFREFVEVEGLGGSHSEDTMMPALTVMDTIACTAAIVGLAASYAGLASCAFTFGIGCALALVGHTAAVVSLVSCT